MSNVPFLMQRFHTFCQNANIQFPTGQLYAMDNGLTTLVAININNQLSVEFDIIGQVVRQQIKSRITRTKIIIGNFASCGHFSDRYFF